MNIVVCIRQGRDGDINPFDACAYEAALRVPQATVTLLSMGPEKTGVFLEKLTRLGAARAILLCDPAFAGADTLATAYTLSLAVKKLAPDLVFCGRQTLEGDTGQVGPMLAAKCGFALITNVMAVTVDTDTITCQTREEGVCSSPFPALITVERIHTLRLPSIRSRVGTVEIWDAVTLGADKSRCGLTGSPTRVLESHENAAGRRRCTFISAAKLREVLQKAATTARQSQMLTHAAVPLKTVAIFGKTPRRFAETVGESILPLTAETPQELIAQIRKHDPDAVLFGTDPRSKRFAAIVAAETDCGLCADCTALDTDGELLYMIRPALSGSVIAKIKSLTRPALATVRTTTVAAEMVVAAGFGVREQLPAVQTFAQSIGAQLAASRRLVDAGLMPYDSQIGLTGRTVAPPVYIAVGVSGAIHHLVGMWQAGTVIAINPDRHAPIFDYADYGVIAAFEDLQELL